MRIFYDRERYFFLKKTWFWVKLCPFLLKWSSEHKWIVRTQLKMPFFQKIVFVDLIMKKYRKQEEDCISWKTFVFRRSYSPFQFPLVDYKTAFLEMILVHICVMFTDNHFYFVKKEYLQSAMPMYSAHVVWSCISPHFG